MGERDCISEDVNTILITAATTVELSLLVRETGAVECAVKGVPLVYGADLGRKRLVLAATGIGKVNAAASAATLTSIFAPDFSINTGCAGAYSGSGLSIGDLALASAEIYAEEGVVTPLGWQSVEAIGIPLAEVEGTCYYNEIPLSETHAERSLSLAGKLNIKLQKGKFVTVSTCSGTAARGVELSGRFGAICENMEGAAVAHVALRYGVPCLEIRGISNHVADRDVSRWDIATAAENAQRFLLRLIDIM